MKHFSCDGTDIPQSDITSALSEFSEWLESDQSVYWVSGKPGSGKSTLMKFLADNAETLRCLRKWAGTKKLVVVGYYFWINGTKLQRSQTGLLRSLLFDIFRKSPELIEATFPSRWKSLDATISRTEMQEAWTLKELQDGFRRLARNDKSSSTALCIFVDGLDEYEGDHEE